MSLSSSPPDSSPPAIHASSPPTLLGMLADISKRHDPAHSPMGPPPLPAKSSIAIPTRGVADSIARIDDKSARVSS
ncbi:hypothetical protein CspHIS471_0205470 [Cutaneotrichosporon sp. HIS471]|nr:hypothetical protein CspHIS471_0205470 [Cutaneotrichosporon sp. HIS471]